MQTFEHLVTTRPHAISHVFVSDLHLPMAYPFEQINNEDTTPTSPLMQAFLRFLDDLLALPKLKYLFILGDWFDVWLGDDVALLLVDKQSGVAQQEGLNSPLSDFFAMLDKLSILSQQGCKIFVMQGNRDFLLGQDFCDVFTGKLIKEPYQLTIGVKTFRLEHGDALCTDDIAYQRFRKLARNRLIQKALLNLSLKRRLNIATKLRATSRQQNQVKSSDIMDVNDEAVASAVSQIDTLLHGHTHRPAIHELKEQGFLRKHGFDQQKTRYVLGDWRVVSKKNASTPEVEAVIGAVVHDNKNESEFRLIKFLVSGDWRF